MSKLYRTREGAVTAVSTRTLLTTLGSETAPGPLIVPAGSTKITKVIAAASSDLAAAAEASFFIRLEGPGLPEGPETFAVACIGVQVATGGSYAYPAVQIPIELPVTAGNEIIIAAENTGEDSGSSNVGVTLVFE